MQAAIALAPTRDPRALKVLFEGMDRAADVDQRRLLREGFDLLPAAEKEWLEMSVEAVASSAGEDQQPAC